MIDEQKKDDFTAKLKRYLANPSSTQEFFEAYKAEHDTAALEDYTKALEDLVTKIEEDKVKDQESLCHEVKELKLPHNQFGC